MSINVTQIDAEKVNRDWVGDLPMLVESESGVVVLAINIEAHSMFYGVYIHPLSIHGGSCLRADFKPYHGKITLENEK